MNRFLYKLLLIFLTSFITLFASQKDSDDIARMSAAPLYNINKNALQSTIKEYIKNYPQLKALKIVESLTGETYISVYKKDGKIIYNKKLPELVKKFKFYKSIARFENEEAGTIYAYFNESNEKELNQKEIAWIKRNPPIKIAVMRTWKPFDMTTNDNKHYGFHSDIATLINKKLSTNIVLVPYNSWGEAYKAAIDGKVNAINSLSWTKQREKEHFIYSQAYHFSPYQIVVKNSNNEITSIDSLKNKIVAVRSKSIIEKIIKKQVPEAKIKFFPSPKDAYASIQKGESHATLIINANEKLLKQYNLKIATQIYHKAGEIYIGTNKKYPIVASIIKKGLNSITLKEMSNLREKWFEDYLKNPLSTFRQKVKELKLTKDEKKWLEKHKNIKVGIQNNWAPLNYVDDLGIPKGLGVDFIELLNQKLNGILKIHPDSFRNNLEKVKTKEIDAMLDITPTKPREEFYHFTTPYITIPKAIVTQKNSKTYYKNEEMLNDKKVAIEKGYLTSKILKKIAPDVTIIDYDNTADALDAVSRGDVDAYVGNKAVVNYIMQRDFITNLSFHARTKNKGSILAIGVRKDWVLLRDILQKALNSITIDERKNIINKYVNQTDSKKIDIKLTKEEKKFIKNHKPIKVGGEMDWAPFDYVDINGEYQGITKDYLDLIGELSGLKFNIKTGQDWSGLLNSFKNKELDMLPVLYYSKDRESFVNYTKPYYVLNQFFFAREDDNSISDIDSLDGKTLAVIKDYYTVELLKKNYPNIKLLEVKNISKCLNSVIQKKSDACIEALAPASYIIEQDFLTGLRVASKADFAPTKIYMGVQKENKTLRNIINKSLKAISADQRNEISKKWVNLNSGSEKKELDIAFNFDQPPFMFGKTSSKGIEADLVKEILESQGYQVNIHQMSKLNMETILTDNNNFDGVSTISDTNDNMFYTNHFIAYENYVITRTNDNIKVDSLKDLTKVSFVAWKGAYNDLGKEFYNFFNPKNGLFKDHYYDKTSQADQHISFFNKEVDAIVVDKTIFQWYKLALRNSNKYTFHKIFPKQTTYPAKFKSKKVRNAFNKGLGILKESGRYDEIVNFYLKQDIRPLLKYSNLIADISGKFIFSHKPEVLKKILNSFFQHTDIMHIEIFDSATNKSFVKLHKDSHKKTTGMQTFPSIIKKIYYTDSGNPSQVGTLKVFYKIKNINLKQEKLIPSLNTFSHFDKNILSFIKKSYDKFSLKSATIGLTPEEEQWINSNVVRVGVEQWAPVIFSNTGKDVSGISGDVLKLIIDKAGLNVEIINDLWDPLLEGLKNKKIDLLPATYYTKERATYGVYSDGYYKMLDYIYVKEENNNIKSMSDLNGKTLAIPKGFGTIPKITEKFPKIKIVETVDLLDSINRVLDGKVDALYDGQIAVEYKLQDELITGLKGIAQRDFKAAQLHLFSRDDMPILQSILNKALKSIPKHEINKIKSKWLLEKQTKDQLTKLNQEVKELKAKGNSEYTWWLLIGAITFFLFLSVLILIVTRFVSDDFVAKNFGSLKFRIIALAGISIVIMMIAVLVYYTLEENKKTIVKNSENDLKFVLNSTKNRLDTWIEDNQKFLLQFGRDTKLVELTKKLNALEKEPKVLKESNELKDIRKFFQKRTKEFGDLGFFIIDKNSMSIASKRDTNIGTKNLIAKYKPDLLKRAFDGEAIFIPPIPTDVNIKSTKNKHLTMFFVVPIQDKEGNVISLLTQRLDVDGQLSNIVQSGRIGQSGESYLFDKNALMLTNSRFNDELQDIGLIKKGQEGYNKIKIKDPGGNLLDGFKTKKSTEDMSLTKMAKHALSLSEKINGQYSKTYSDVQGYRDYRGVDVFGAWIWNNELGIGLTTELDKDEALSGFYLLRQNLLIITVLTMLLTILSIVMLIILGEKATRSIHKANDELNKLLSSFDEHVIASKTDLKGIITYASEAFIEVSGYTKEELIGKPQNTVRHPDMPKAVFQDLWQTIKSGNIWRGEVKNKTKDGGFYWVAAVITPEFDFDGKPIGYSAIRHDITAQKEVEEQTKILNTQNKEMEAMLEIFDDHIISSKSDLEGYIIAASKAFGEISGYEVSELIGKQHSTVRHPDMSSEIFEDLWKTIQGGKAWKGELKNLRKDGSFYWVDIIIEPEFDEDGNITSYNAIRQDITSKKEVEELSANLEIKVEERTSELKESEKRFVTLFDAAPDSIAIIKDGQYINCNQKTLELFGIKNQEEFFNSVPSDFSPEFQENDERSDILAPRKIAEAIEKGYTLFEWKHKNCATNKVFDAEVILSSITLNDEPHLYAVVRDITQRKLLEKIVEQNKLFLDALLDSQEQIVITTDGKTLRSVNKKFLEFFNLENMEEFTKDNDSICDKFENDEINTYLQKEMGELMWIDYVIEHEELNHKTVIMKNNIERIFSVTAAIMPIEDGLIKSAVFTDITELENQKKQTESILSSVLLPMLITSKKTRKIVYANSFAERQYETSLSEIVGSPIDIFYTSDHQRDQILNEMKDKGTIENFETRFKTFKDNEFDAILSLIDINFGGEECFLGVASDITEQKSREAVMQKLHKNITDSIEYASLIQHSLIPDNTEINSYFKDYFTIWHPKDIVGGDIYLFEELRDENECLLMVIDCTGHGVPGAFVTMLVKAIERQIISDIINNRKEKVSPAFILEYFNKTMKKLLKQEDDESISNAGFDGGVLYYNKNKNIIRYAGAETPLFYIQNEELHVIKGNRHSIGYKKSDSSFKFTDHEIKIDTPTKFYITTDGYFDQNGGDKGFPYGKKRFQKFLEKNHHEKFSEQKELLLYEMQEYQGDEERNDDVTLVGLNIEPTNKKQNKISWDI